MNDLPIKNKKTIRTLTNAWLGLLKPDNFLVPETLDEYAQFGFFAPKIMVNGTERFFNEKSKNDLSDFVNILYGIEEIKAFISYDTAYKTTLSFIEDAVLRQIKHSIKTDVPHPKFPIPIKTSS